MRRVLLLATVLSTFACGADPLHDRDLSLEPQLSQSSLKEIRLVSPGGSLLAVCPGHFDSRPLPQWAVLTFSLEAKSLRLFVVAEPKPGLATAIQVTTLRTGFNGSDSQILTNLLSITSLRCISAKDTKGELKDLNTARQFKVEGNLRPLASFDLMDLAESDATSYYFQWNESTKSFDEVGWRSN